MRLRASHRRRVLAPLPDVRRPVVGAELVNLAQGGQIREAGQRAALASDVVRPAHSGDWETGMQGRDRRG